MSRSEKEAYEIYPAHSTTSELSSAQVDLLRKGFINGYEQAREDMPKWNRTNTERGVAFGWGLSKSPERGHVVFINGYELSIDEAWEKLEKEPPTDMMAVCPARFVLLNDAELKSCSMPKVPPKYKLDVKSNEELLRKAASDLVNAVEQYVEPKLGTEYMHRTKILAIKNKIKELL